MNTEEKDLANRRYILQIQFKADHYEFYIRVWDIYEPFKTLKECEKASDGLIDHTVRRAQIVDSVTNKIVKQLA